MRAILLAVSIAFLAGLARADEQNEKRLASFLAGKRYEVIGFDWTADARTTEIAEKMQRWVAENPQRFRDLVKQNPGGALPFQPDMDISREDYEWFVSPRPDAMRDVEVGPKLIYETVHENESVTFRLVNTEVEEELEPATIPFAVNMMLTKTTVSLKDTRLKLINFDVGPAEWASGKSDFLGEWNGFKWRHDDERLIDFEQMPEGAEAALVVVQLYHSKKHNKVYGRYKLAVGNNEGFKVNSDVSFWMTVHK